MRTRRIGNRFGTPALIAALALSLCLDGRGGLAQGAAKTASPGQRETYEADMETRQGAYIMQAHVLYDRGKFRQGIRRPGASKADDPRHIVMYDGEAEGVLWEYRSELRSAWPALESVYQRLAAAVRRDGEATVRQRYNLPAQFMFSTGGTLQRLRPEYGLKTLADFTDLEAKPRGTAIVAGRSCRIYQTRSRSGRTPARPGGAEVGQANRRFERVWLEPRTGWVLRWERRIEPPANSPWPPIAASFTVKMLRFVKTIPAECFQLPPGTVAKAPRLFEGITLPPGVTRANREASWADIGLDLSKIR